MAMGPALLSLGMPTLDGFTEVVFGLPEPAVGVGFRGSNSRDVDAILVREW